MEEAKFVIRLEAIEDHNVALVGAKALNLARMSRIGLPVPPGFCITGAAYRQHLNSGDLTSQISASLASLQGAPPEGRRKTLSEIRQDIIECLLSEKTTDEMTREYESLGERVVAVRSSATAEDLSGQSFAGQYDTYLGVSGLSECLRSVKRCWASLWTDRSFEYRGKYGVNHLDVDMAVIVQKLVPADASGVLFGADPRTGHADRLIIEGSFGLGEAVVKGRVIPDRFVVSKKRFRLLERVISNKTFEIVPAAEGGGVREESVPQEQRVRPCLEAPTVKRLARLALRVEKLFGCPQDIEWAVRDGKVFLLQSRPLTALPTQTSVSWEDRQVWTNANTGEVAPDVITPLTWSIIQAAVRCLFEPVFSLLSIQVSDNPLFGLVAGRVYFSVNTIDSILRHLPRPLYAGINRAFGGEQGRMSGLGQLRLRDDDLPDVKFSLPRTILKAPLSLLRLTIHNPKRGERFLNHIYRKAKRLQGLDIASMSEDELSEGLTEGVENVRRFKHGFLYVVRGLGAFPILMVCTRRWLGDTDGSLANSLLAGSGSMDSALAGQDLWRLAEKAHEIPTVQKAILVGDVWKATRARISRMREGDQFLKKWDEFMDRHGHHTRGEIELFNPRWSETPEYILELVRGYLGCIGQNDPLERYSRRARERKQSVRQCRRQLKNPIKRMIFNCLLAHAQQGSALRENAKSEPMRYWAGLRRIALELGKRFATRGVLDNPDDIFFLELREIAPVRRGKANFDPRRLIAARRDEYERNKSITPPKVVVGKFDPDNFAPDTVDVNAEVLTGIAVSAGVATGKARVILRASVDEQVLPGEILVAPFTDPGWTPYFLPAAAIVMDLGGLLSHGSILAREYGIPAVVNVGPATRIIRTGQTVHVDGNRGQVRILR